jgi:hypothetical protein
MNLKRIIMVKLTDETQKLKSAIYNVYSIQIMVFCQVKFSRITKFFH